MTKSYNKKSYQSPDLQSRLQLIEITRKMDRIARLIEAEEINSGKIERQTAVKYLKENSNDLKCWIDANWEASPEPNEWR